jgi:hypothetical protein
MSFYGPTSQRHAIVSAAGSFTINAPDAGLIVEDGVIGIFPAERFAPLDAFLRVLLA